MLDKLREISQAWLTAFNPTELQKELSQKRYNICLGCKWYRETRPITHDEHCGECHCPLSKKIFSQKKGACDIGNWDEIDNEYPTIFEKKDKKTII